MTHEQALRWLHDLARRWRIREYCSIALKSFGIALVLGVAVRALFAWDFVLMLAAGAMMFALCLWFWPRKPRHDLQLLARHLNRTVPALEESCELLLKTETILTGLEKLQCERVLRMLDEHREEAHLPIKLLRDAVKFASICIALAALLQYGVSMWRDYSMRRAAAFIMPISTTTPLRNQAPPATLEAVRIEITPPAYTNKPRRTVDDCNVVVEENARVVWRLKFDRPLTRVEMIVNAIDTLTLQAVNAPEYVVARPIAENFFYQFVFRDSSHTARPSNYFRVEVLKDNAPVLTIAELAPRTIIMPGQLPVMDLQAQVEDDYGLVHVMAFATLARGTGEAVRFREAQLDFAKTDKVSARVWQLQTTLDLVQLGMAPGDELYFSLEAQDNRAPVANRSRSETFFVVWQDTARAVAVASNGLMVNPLPEYFRSQRQIIIDTEKLIADRPRLSTSEFQKRAQNLGFDQQALRMRYGEYLGEELEAGGVPEAEHEGEKIDKSAADTKESAVDKIVEQFEHQHDVAENATLFAPSVKTQLKAALAEMWDAELHLRMYRPEAALPFEYRALALLKSVQQHNRVYVQRIGFAATPIKVEEKRLTGDLEKITNRTRRQTVSRDSTLQEVRAALAILRAAEQEQALPSAKDLAILEHARSTLARAALMSAPKSLLALQDLHLVITDFKNHHTPSAQHLLAVQNALWQLLPPSKPIPVQRSAVSSTLARRYFDKLQ